MKSNILLFLLLFFYINISAKILIFTYAFNRPDFIGLQHKTFKKYLTEDYDFIIFSDAISDEMHNKIKAECDAYNLTCIRIPQEIHDKPYLPRPEKGFFSDYHDPAVRNSNVIQYSLDTLGFDHNDILMIIDSDAFLIKKFDIRRYLDNALLAGPVKPCSAWPIHDCKKLHPSINPFTYLWAGLVIFDMKNLPNKKSINMNCGYLYNNTIPVDAGGFLHSYLKDNQEVEVKYSDHTVLQKLFCNDCQKKTRPVKPCTHNRNLLVNYGLNQHAIKFVQNMPLPNLKEGRDCEFLLNGTFIHYRCGSNYINFDQKFENIKTELFNAFFNDILQ